MKKLQVEELTMEKDLAKQELRALKKAIKQNHLSKKQALVRDFLKVYGHLQHGTAIIDLQATFKKTGLRKQDGFPKLAIVVAGAKYCHCYKRLHGAAVFSKNRKQSWDIRVIKSHGDIGMPKGTFNWATKEGYPRTTTWLEHYKEPHAARCVAPIIPAKILVEHVKALLPNYHILFEAESWQKIPKPPRDPILGKMLTPNLFGVLATWDLTPLERAIIKGRVA